MKNRFYAALSMFAVLLLAGHQRLAAQVKDTIAVGHSTSTLLLFGGGDLQFDCGSADVSVRTAEGKVFLQAKAKGFAETNLFVHSGNEVYLFIVTYADKPKRLMYDYTSATGQTEDQPAVPGRSVANARPPAQKPEGNARVRKSPSADDGEAWPRMISLGYQVAPGIGVSDATESTNINPIYLGFDLVSPKPLGIGRIGADLLIGVAYSHAESIGGSLTMTQIHAIGRGKYHFEIPGNSKLRPYAGLSLGYYSVTTDVESGFYGDASGTGSTTALGIFGGTRYFFTERFGAYGEVSRSLQSGAEFAVTLGLMIKMRK